jgi:hypothetical protein
VKHNTGQAAFPTSGNQKISADNLSPTTNNVGIIKIGEILRIKFSSHYGLLGYDIV